MSDDKPLPGDLDPDFYTTVGEIASDWGTLEYVVSQCMWSAAQVDEQLGACITAQIASLPAKLESLALLLRARGVSARLMSDFQRFIQDSRRPTELRNCAVHDPLGVHKEDSEPRQLQITARGKLVFEVRKITLEDMIKNAREITVFLDRFFNLRDRIEGELSTLPYTSRTLFPQILRSPRQTQPTC
jgi:hypothetical protein